MYQDLELYCPQPDEVRALRESKELSPSQAAGFVGVTANAWHKWESGDRRMPSAHWKLFRIEMLFYKPDGSSRVARRKAKSERSKA